MDSTTATGLIGAFFGALLGGGLSITGILLGKRAERRSTLNRIIAEKRLEAYEQVIAHVRWASIGLYEDKMGISERWPILFDDPEKFSEWTAVLPVIDRKVSHLIHSELAEQLWVLQDYILRLEGEINPYREPTTFLLSENELREVGKIVYKDFIELTTRVIREASRFYTNEIYKLNFMPATLNMDLITLTLPHDYKDLAIFTRRTEIETALSGHHSANE